MLYQTLRPKGFSEFLGNKAVVGSLVELTRDSRCPHAILFQGPSGCGKTTLARIVATTLGAGGVDLVEYNAANLRGIDTVREITLRAPLSPLVSTAKGYILDECHQFTPAAQEALLKVVEETPPHTYFFFCSTEPHKLTTTLRNRCTIFELSSLRDKDMREVLKRGASHLKVPLEEKLIQMILEAAAGCPRRALVLLEQCSSLGSLEDCLELVSLGAPGEREILELCREVAAGRANSWKEVITIFPRLNTSDPELIRKALLGYLQQCLLTSSDPGEALRYSDKIRILSDDTFAGGKAKLLSMLFESSFI